MDRKKLIRDAIKELKSALGQRNENYLLVDLNQALTLINQAKDTVKSSGFKNDGRSDEIMGKKVITTPNKRKAVLESVLLPESLVNELLEMNEKLLVENKGKDCFRWRYLMDALADRPKQIQ